MLQVLNGRGQIAATHAELDGNVTAAVFTVDHEGPIAGLYIRDLADGHPAPVRRGQQDTLNGFWTVAISLGKADSQIEPAIAFNDLGDGCPAHGSLDGGIHVSRSQT